MSAETDSWSVSKEAKFLARLAHELTVCARDTYEIGTNKVAEPELLRDYNEVQHRVTGSLRDHVLQSNAMPVAVVVEMVRDFGIRHQREKVIEGAISRVEQRMSHDETSGDSSE